MLFELSICLPIQEPSECSGQGLVVLLHVEFSKPV